MAWQAGASYNEQSGGQGSFRWRNSLSLCHVSVRNIKSRFSLVKSSLSNKDLFIIERAFIRAIFMGVWILRGKAVGTAIRLSGFLEFCDLFDWSNLADLSVTLTGIDIDVVDATGHEREPVSLLCSATLGREGETADCDVNSGGGVGAIWAGGPVSFTLLRAWRQSVRRDKWLEKFAASTLIPFSLRWRLSFCTGHSFSKISQSDQ